MDKVNLARRILSARAPELVARMQEMVVLEGMELTIFADVSERAAQIRISGVDLATREYGGPDVLASPLIARLLQSLATTKRQIP